MGKLAGSSAPQVDGFAIVIVISCRFDGAHLHLLAQRINVIIPHAEGCGAVEAAVDAAALTEWDMYV